MQDVLVNQPVVIDNGSGTIKAGFAGQDHPKCFFPSLCACKLHCAGDDPDHKP